MVQLLPNTLSVQNLSGRNKFSLGQGVNLDKDVAVPFDIDLGPIERSPDVTTSANMAICSNETTSSILTKLGFNATNKIGHLFGVFETGSDFEFLNSVSKIQTNAAGRTVIVRALCVYETGSEALSVDLVMKNLSALPDLRGSSHIVTKVVFGGHAEFKFEYPLEDQSSFMQVQAGLKKEVELLFGVASVSRRNLPNTQYLGNCTVTATGTLNRSGSITPKNAVAMLTHLREYLITDSHIRYELTSLDTISGSQRASFRLRNGNFCMAMLERLEAVERLVKEAELSVFDFLSKFRFALAAGIPTRLVGALNDIRSRMKTVSKTTKRSLVSTDNDDDDDDDGLLDQFVTLASKTIKRAESLVKECEEYEQFIHTTCEADISRVTADLPLDAIVSEHLSTYKNGQVVVFTADHTRREQSEELKAIFDKLSHKFSSDLSKKLVIRIAEEPLASSDGEAKHGIAMFRNQVKAFKCDPTWNLTDECRALTSPHIRAQKDVREKVEQYPSDLPPLQIPCQCAKDSSKDPKNKVRRDPPLWRCEDCHVEFLFDSDDWLYCKCQKASRVKVQDCSFLCMEGNHVSSFVKCDPTLSLGDIRVLVLGQSGCGKSTTIDFIFNSHLFKDLPDAILNNLKMVAPIPVTFQADGYGKLQPDGSILPSTSAGIMFGDVSTVSDRENINFSGKSATKICTQYIFVIYGRKVIFIDCPGALDTAGFVKDLENAEHIVNFISNSKYLSAVLLVMKPNEERITSEVMCSVIQSLENLNRDLANNIFLAFTCSSTTNFALAGTEAVLQKVQDSLASPRSKLNLLDRDRMFFLDHNGFRLAVAYANGFVLANDDDGELYRSVEYQWRRSSEESYRLIRELLLIPKASTKGMKELFHSKTFINNIADVLVRIVLASDDSVAAIKAIQLELMKAIERGEDLNQKLMVPKTVAEVVRLDHPITVCTESTCSEVVPTGDAGSSNVIKFSVCHDLCWLEGVTQNCISPPDLEYCTVMQDRKCTTCASNGHTCSVEMHMHMVTEVKTHTTMVEHPGVLKALRQNNALVNQNSSLQAFYKDEIEAIESEKERITKACALFVSFILSKSLITPNDSIVNHLETDIEVLERFPVKTPSQVNQLASVKAMKKRYEEELKLLEEYRNSGASEESIDVERIDHELEELYNLPRYGDSIRKCVKQLREHASDLARDPILPHAKANCNSDKH
ncbi:hypothetical protein HDU97_007774 [Phlyctochytrium planicorne]|nr:hypothetical protein HDU97_007774 [Phlyctochytrium planicorne]